MIEHSLLIFDHQKVDDMKMTQLLLCAALTHIIIPFNQAIHPKSATSADNLKIPPHPPVSLFRNSFQDKKYKLQNQRNTYDNI